MYVAREVGSLPQKETEWTTNQEGGCSSFFGSFRALWVPKPCPSKVVGSHSLLFFSFLGDDFY